MTRPLVILATITGYILMLIALVVTFEKTYISIFIWAVFLSAAMLICCAMVVSLFVKEPKESSPPSDKS